jgi:chromate transporter
MSGSHTERPTFREALRFWVKLGFISFGGPTGQIAIMQTELVERKRWISQSRFLHALNFCMVLPGPEAMQLAIYIGWLLHKVRGGIVAGALFVIPSIFVLWLLSFIYVAYGAVPWVAAIFYGLKPAVTAIVIVAVIRIGRKALRTPAMWAIAVAAFAAIYFFHVPFPAIILGAGVIGAALGWRQGSKQASSGPFADESAATEHSLGRVFRIAAVCLVLWFAPVVLIGALRGWSSTLFQEGIFFSKAAVVTFGGAYAVLPYVGQQALFHYGWLKPGQMMDGLGLAETTPGPLIMVLQFVGFVGAWQHPEGLSPLVAATIGALLTTWVTFTPCFLWILAGAPYIERLRDNTRLTAALSAVTAAVVGVILNLAVWFAAHVFIPVAGSVDWIAIVLCAAALLAMLRFNVGIIAVIAASGLAGLLIQFVR